MSDTTQRCSGCGHAPGSIVIVRNSRNQRPGPELVSALTEVPFLDEEPRQFCTRCRRLARKTTQRVRKKHLTVGKVRTAIAQPEPLALDREGGR